LPEASHPAFFVGKTSKGKAQVLLFGWSLQGGERRVEWGYEGSKQVAA